jgi:uncharacterized protein (DUF1800 family)
MIGFHTEGELLREMWRPKLSGIVRSSYSAGLPGCCLGVMICSLVAQGLFVQPVVSQENSETALNAAGNRTGQAANPKLWTVPLDSDQKILQLLSRLTFGPRPGDVERTRKVGIKEFLDQQLHPEKIDDSAVEARIAQLPTLSMTSEELAENFREIREERLERQRTRQTAPENDTRSADSETRGASRASDVRRPGRFEAKPAAQMPPGMTMTNADAPQQGGPQDPRRPILELAQEELLRAVYSNRQLQEEMVQFWMNHFNIFASKGADRWLMTSYERDTIRPHAMGKFKDLLIAIAESPAMLFYLDNWLSSTPNPPPAIAPTLRSGIRPGLLRRGFGLPLGPVFQLPAIAASRPGHAAQPGQAAAKRQYGLNENYGRELMELHTLGVDGGYTQKDVIEVARCLTGWTIDRPNRVGEFIFNPRLHYQGDKIVLGHRIKGRQGMAGMEEGLEVLHVLAHHPSTAHLISLKLCRRFVTDDPPPTLVNRASDTFLKTDGDIRAVLKTILTSPEFYSQAAYRAKVKSPLELVASSIRALGADTDAGIPLLQFIARMGQPLFQYQAPTGFPDRSSTWINSDTLLMRMNYALALSANQIRGTPVDMGRLDLGTEHGSEEAVLNALSLELLNGSLPPETREAILAQFNAGQAPGPDASGLNTQSEASTLVAFLLASPDFQRR